jgi:hypothetical protein
MLLSGKEPGKGLFFDPKWVPPATAKLGEIINRNIFMIQKSPTPKKTHF